VMISISSRIVVFTRSLFSLVSERTRILKEDDNRKPKLLSHDKPYFVRIIIFPSTLYVSEEKP